MILKIETPLGADRADMKRADPPDLMNIIRTSRSVTPRRGPAPSPPRPLDTSGGLLVHPPAPRRSPQLEAIEPSPSTPPRLHPCRSFRIDRTSRLAPPGDPEKSAPVLYARFANRREVEEIDRREAPRGPVEKEELLGARSGRSGGKGGGAAGFSGAEQIGSVRSGQSEVSGRSEIFCGADRSERTSTVSDRARDGVGHP